MLLYFSFPFISFACSWIILCFSLRFFIARVDSASYYLSLFFISECKIFCSSPPQCSYCIHQHNSKLIRLALSSSSSFSFLSSFFFVFVVFIPRADRGVVCMRYSEYSRSEERRVVDYDTHSRVSSRKCRIRPSQPSNSPPLHVFGMSETRRDESPKYAEFFWHTHVNDAPIGPGNENDENDEKGRRKRKRRGGEKGKSNSF